MNSVLERNRLAWDERVRRGQSHTAPARDEDFAHPLSIVDDCGWLGGNVRGQRVLCLAAGGGKHGVLFAAAGAVVTVVDLSSRMLDQDRALATQRGLQLQTVQASIDDLCELGDGTFDAVIQPVSTCYVPDLRPVFSEVARVTKAAGLYISQHKQPACLQAEILPTGKGYLITEPQERSEPLPAVLEGCQHREAGTLEFVHSWEQLLGGLCRAGFVIEDLLEPCHGDLSAEPGTFRHRCAFLPPFVTVKARRVQDAAARSGASQLWVP